MADDAIGFGDKSRPWSGSRGLPAALLATLAVSALLIAVPSLDRAMSGAFYAPGQGFGGKPGSLVNIVRWIGFAATAVMIGGLIAAVVAKLLPNVGWQGLTWPDLKFLIAAWAIGPGLVVNLILKSFWGRARPVQTDWFGGQWPYSPPWLPVDHCSRNCSFVSGEASASFCLLALAFVAPPAWRRTVAIAALLFALAIGWARIAAGGHYLSDVVIAWGLTLIAILAARWWFPGDA